MMADNKSKTLKILSIIAIIIMLALLIDIILIYNIYYIWKPDAIYMNKYIRLGIEAIILIVLFYALLFIKASKGELLLYKEGFPDKFPFKRYLIISSIIILVLEMAFWILRIIKNAKLEPMGFSHFLIFFLLTVFSYMIICDVLMLSFYLSYVIAKRKVDKASALQANDN